MELNVWTSTTVLHASQNPENKKWSVLVRRPDNSERTLTVNHLVFATGFRGGRPNIPVYPGTVCILLFLII
jgi:cation diffusion facilitator CzcD-associated flavoprotein CzcO